MPQPRLRALLLVAGAGAVLVLVDLLGTFGALAGLAAMIAGLVLSAVAAPRPGPGVVNWWSLLAVGTALVAVGIPLGLPLETIGGLTAAAGAALAVVAVALALP